ncbi:MAG: hypothetical protein JNK85_16710 [Verrucomicrobiales bacterium]|nr:hypothetical protein [Verrucomicrobiales bacterium]
MKDRPFAILKGHRRHTSCQEREDWIKAWEASDQTQEDFARVHGLKVGTLRSWIRRQSRTSHATVPLKEVNLAEVIGPGLTAQSACWELEIRFPNGCSLLVARGTPVSRIQELAEVLRC